MSAPGLRGTVASDVRVVAMAPSHADAVLRIYQSGLDTGEASFETTAPDWATWDATHLDRYRLVAVDGTGEVLGWVALSPVSERCVYAGVAETSVYVADAARARGVGSALLRALTAETDRGDIWTLQAGVFPENAASVALHVAAGFRVVGRRERIGQRDGRWRDTLLLERRRPGD